MATDKVKRTVMQISNPDASRFHFAVSSITSSTNYTLIDVSDTTNYPHSNSNEVQLDWMRVHINCSSQANYELAFGMLDSVTNSNSNLYIFDGQIGQQSTNVTGQDRDLFLDYHPNGIRMDSSRFVTSASSIGNTVFNASSKTLSTYNTTSLYAASGNGDVVLLTKINAGTVSLKITGSYVSF